MEVAASRPFILTSIGKKYLMGLMGLIWAGFVLTHMAGNMLILVGGDLYNKYGNGIVTSGILIPAEIALLLSLIIHVALAFSLTFENRRARGQVRYAAQAKGLKAVSLASRTMAIQGTLILVFIILHLATFKYGTYYETIVDGIKMRDLNRLVLEIFHQPGYVAWYCLCLVLLGFHLSHGVGSVFQSFGFKNDRHAGLIRKLSLSYGVIVALGFLSQPIYVFFIAG